MRIRMIVSLLLVLAVLTACGSKPSATAVPTTRPQNTAVSAQSTVQPTLGAKEQPSRQPTTPLAEPTRPAEEVDLGESSSLDNLDSYRAAYSWKWSETKDGALKTGFWDALEEYSKADSARHTVWSGTEGAIEIIRIGQYTYMKSDDKWIAMLTTDSDPVGTSAFMTDPLSLISGKKGKLV